MQLLPKEIKSSRAVEDTVAIGDECVDAVLNVAPPVVRAIRKMMREHRLPELSVPQFRTLSLLNFSPDASLSIVADYVGSSLPAASRMIEGLVAKNLVCRTQCCKDRRQVSLKLTPVGREAFLESRQATRLQLAQRLSALSSEKKEAVVQAMECLGEVFGSDARLASGFPISSSEGNCLNE